MIHGTAPSGLRGCFCSTCADAVGLEVVNLPPVPARQAAKAAVMDECDRCARIEHAERVTKTENGVKRDLTEDERAAWVAEVYE